MFRNFFLISLRNLSRQKGFSFINILGLSLAFTVGFLIILYILSELSFDKFHKDYQRIFRVCVEGKLSGSPLNMAITPAGLGGQLKKDYPEVETNTVFHHLGNKQLLGTEEKRFYITHILYADSSFLKLFNFKLIQGDQKTALNTPNKVVLTKSMAQKYFGDTIPLGKKMRLNNQTNLTVSGVTEDPPEETHLAFNLIISFETLTAQLGPEIYDNWGSLNYYTYIKLAEGVSRQNFDKQIAGLINTKIHETDGLEENVSVKPYLQPVKDIHLRSKLIGEIKPSGDYSYIYILSAIALLILFIAGVNYVNLSMARSSNRGKEVAIRKILGCGKTRLTWQFIGESVFFSLIGLIIAISLIELLLPVFNEITSKSISLSYVESLRMLMIYTGIAILFGIFSGTYPALFLSTFNPVNIIQARIKKKPGKKTLRNSLVLIQFSISAGLIISTVVVYKQLDYLMEKNPGFEQENLMTIFLRNEEVKMKAVELKTDMLKIKGVEAATLASSVPGTSLSASTLYAEGFKKKPIMVYNFDVDKDFPENTFRMEIIGGRNFSDSIPSDSTAIIINEQLKNTVGWKNAIGKKFSSNPEDSTQLVFHVIGVIKDFNFRSLHHKIEPTALFFHREQPGFLVLRVEGNDHEETIARVSRTWSNFHPDLPFDYEYLGKSYKNLYASERKLGLLFIYLTVFAIFISSMGLYGLSSYSTEQRTRELGIRKALGASVMDISSLLSVEYLKLVLYANLIAWPLAFILMKMWLKSYYFNTYIPLLAFFLAGVLTFIPTFIVINIQIFKIQKLDPVRALKYE